MKKNYAELIRKIDARSNPDSYALTKMFSETLSGSKTFINEGIEYSDVSEYIRKAMKGVPHEYTMNSKVAANKVEAHLKKSHGGLVQFDRQGSIMTNTHILKDHDVDLIQITNKSSGFDHDGLNKALEKPETLKTVEIEKLQRHKRSFSTYQGDYKNDLALIRKKSEDVLVLTYNDVDKTGANSICVQVSDPKRTVDVVTAKHYKGVHYMKTDKDYRRGIQVYNKATNSVGDVDYPFWSIKRINTKNIATGQRLANMIRFLKNVKFDCPHIVNKGAIRSFHINAICYNIPQPQYENENFLDLVAILNNELSKILKDDVYRKQIMSVDGTENIFEKNEEKKLEEIAFLKEEVDSIVSDLRLQTILVG